MSCSPQTTVSSPPSRRYRGFWVLVQTKPTEFEALIYEPTICLILQGQKLTTVGDRRVELSAWHSVIISHDLPVLARIQTTTPVG